MRHTSALALIALALAVVVGCSPVVSDADVVAVEHAVRAYNEALIKGFVSFDMNALNLTATEEQAQRDYYLMAALGEGRVQMFSTLQSIEFGEVTFPGEGKASVTTTETWDYEHVSLDTSETVRTETGVVYHLQYDLVLQDGRWLVAGVTSLDETTESQETTQ
ncbi:MAG: hypothetical protein Q7W51_06775 [Coriobacteriia bacterium]|nr:hypothetical protein [Coriobacteriia bacterium]